MRTRVVAADTATIRRREDRRSLGHSPQWSKALTPHLHQPERLPGLKPGPTKKGWPIWYGWLASISARRSWTCMWCRRVRAGWLAMTGEAWLGCDGG